mgnify:CR=1 FL=1
MLEAVGTSLSGRLPQIHSARYLVQKHLVGCKIPRPSGHVSQENVDVLHQVRSILAVATVLATVVRFCGSQHSCDRAAPAVGARRKGKPHAGAAQDQLANPLTKSAAFGAKPR